MVATDAASHRSGGSVRDHRPPVSAHLSRSDLACDQGTMRVLPWAREYLGLEFLLEEDGHLTSSVGGQSLEFGRLCSRSQIPLRQA